MFNIVNEESGTPVENPVYRVLREGIIVGLANHTTLIAKDGVRRPIADSGAPIRNERGETIGVVLVFNDQSERKLLHAQLMQAQKMEAIGRLAGGVAHDFNNVIAVILGNARLIEHAISPLDPIAKKVQAIVSAAERSAESYKTTARICAKAGRHSSSAELERCSFRSSKYAHAAGR